MANTRGKQNQDKRNERRRMRRDEQPAHWEAVDGDILKSVLDVVADKGGALRLGRSRDGGAYSIGIYGDGDPYTEYLPGKEDINAYLTDLADYFREIEGD